MIQAYQTRFMNTGMVYSGVDNFNGTMDKTNPLGASDYIIGRTRLNGILNKITANNVAIRKTFASMGYDYDYYYLEIKDGSQTTLMQFSHAIIKVTNYFNKR